MPTSERRTSSSGKPPAAIQRAIAELPWYQRIFVKIFGLFLMIAPAWAGIAIIPHLVHEGVSWVLALIILGFLSVTAFVGLLITIPKAAVYVADFVAHHVPIPEKWRRLTERPERRNG